MHTDAEDLESQRREHGECVLHSGRCPSSASHLARTPVPNLPFRARLQHEQRRSVYLNG